MIYRESKKAASLRRTIGQVFLLGAVGVMAGLCRAESLPTIQPREPAQILALSAKGGAPTSITFVNHLDRSVVVKWIDYSGNLVPYATLEPNQSYVQATFVSHPWVVFDKASGKAIEGFLPLEQAAMASITLPAILARNETLPTRNDKANEVANQQALVTAINEGFKRWSGIWMVDRYIVDSVQLVRQETIQNVEVAEGTFAFARGQAMFKIPFAAALHRIDGGYSIGRLCYNDQTAGMKDCSDTYTVSTVNPQALAALLLVAAAASELGSSSGSSASEQMSGAEIQNNRLRAEENERSNWEVVNGASDRAFACCRPAASQSSD